MRTRLCLALACALLGGCFLPAFELEGKWCSASDPCPDGITCVPVAGADHGVCAAHPPSCPGTPLGDACQVGRGACERSGTWICALEGPSCSVLAGAPVAESCNGIDDDCDGEIDDTSGCVLTRAGAGPPGFADGPADSARFGAPAFLNVDGAGGLLVADSAAHALRQVDASGSVTTLAGTGRCGFQDGPAAQAALCGPTEAFPLPDGGGLYFSDTLNRRLRLLAGGQVTTVAGSGASGDADGPALSATFRAPMGIHVLPSGDVLIADRDSNKLRRYSPGPPATVTTEAGTGVAGYLDGNRGTMQLDHPVDVLADSGGGLYVTERHLVRRLPPGADSALLAGWNTPGFTDSFAAVSVRFNQPMQVSFAIGGYLVVADPLNQRLRAIDSSNGTTATLTGGGAGFANGSKAYAALREPVGVAWLGGNVYVFSDGNARLRKVNGDAISNVTNDFSGGSWETQASDGPSATARLSAPRALIRTQTGELWWVEPQLNLVRRLRSDGVVETVVGSLTGYPSGAVNGAFGAARASAPSGLALAADGRIYVADRWNHAIRRVDPAQPQVTTAVGPSTAVSGLVNGTLAQARFDQPTVLTADRTSAGGDVLFVFDANNHLLRRVDLGGDQVTTFAGTAGAYGTADGIPGTGQLGNVSALCPDGQGGVWIGDQAGNLLRHADAAGLLTTVPVSLAFPPSAIARDGTTGRLVIAGSAQLATVDPVTGAIGPLLPGLANPSPLGFVDGTANAAASVRISGLVVDDQQLLFTDEGANRVRRYWR